MKPGFRSDTNYYHRAPVADIVRYVEDLALWGYNTIGAWPDKHHFEGIDDPEFQAFLARLAEIFAGAKAIGMKVNLLTLANDGYRTTPKELIGTDTRRAWYGCEICPSTPAGMALVLSNHRETLECLAGIGLDYYTLWSYDQGGCGCAACAPWGAKGMLECGKEVASLVKARQPSCRIVYSTWLFDYCGEPEWAGLDAALARGQGEWIDILLAESHGQYPRYPLEHGSPGGRPLVSFPEISMRLIHPWGGSGSNPMHRINAGIWGQCAALCDGGVLYSEGIFEDINKALYAGFYWNRNNAVEETLREYARFELGCPEASYHDLRRALDTLEDNSAFALIRDLSDSQPGYDLSGKGYRRVRYGAGVAWSRSAFAANAREACAAVLAVDGALPPWARNAWRWRLLKLRATIDAERQDHPDVVTERCADCFEELKELYHAVEGLSLSSVCPPTRKAVLGRLPGVR